MLRVACDQASRTRNRRRHGRRDVAGAVVSQSRRLVQPDGPRQPPLIEPCVRFSLTRLSDDVHVATVAALL
jgi:hypothetical protein